MKTNKPEQVADTTKTYYDSSDADLFYSKIWGGEDIHIGIYADPEEEIKSASQRTVATMAKQLNLQGSEEILDLGSGYGGAARYLAMFHHCKITCLNLSSVENDRNRKLNHQSSLSDKIQVFDGNFEGIPFDNSRFDIVWSEDAILHSGQKEKVFKEVARVLKGGGSFIFTDPMQADDCPDNVLQPVLDRIHLDSLGSFALYKQLAAEAGFKLLSEHNLSENLVLHYSRVKQELRRRKEELSGEISSEYIENMLKGLQYWVEAGEKGYLAWGILHFQKT